MVDEPKPNKDYIYHYKDGSGWKYKGTPYNTAGWTSVEIAGKIIEKIGPILAINKLIFTTTMLLKNLISNLKPDISAIKIKGISFDSRSIKKDEIFVSIKGDKFDGKNYVNKALSKGAKVIVHSQKLKKNKKAIYLKVLDTREELARLSTQYFKKKPKNIIAVTGTNGKTSIADFFHQILTLQKKKVGFIGTLGFKKNQYLKRRKLTTLDPLSLNKDLEEMKKHGVENVIIEASSHGLKQKRLNFLKIKAGIFTNLGHDHLDYHKNMKDYFNSKLLLFNKILKKNSIMITDSDIEQFQVLKNIKKKKLKLYTIGSRSNCLKILCHKIYKTHQILKLKIKNKIYTLKLIYMGQYK